LSWRGIHALSVKSRETNLGLFQMLEKYQDSIEIRGVAAAELELVLSFIYIGEVTISDSNVYDLMAAANYLAVPSK